MHVFFDIDGCISDDRHRVHYRKERNWEAYHSRAYADCAINLQTIRDHAEAGDTLHLLTARPERYRGATLDWLRENVYAPLDWPAFNSLSMRPDDNTDPSPWLKHKQLAQFMTDYKIEPQHVLVYDDRRDVLDEVEKMGVQVCVLDRVAHDNRQQLKKDKEMGAGFFDHSKLDRLIEAIDDMFEKPEAPSNDSPADVLRAMAETFEGRAATYGDQYSATYLTFGHVLAAIYPNGLTLSSAEDFQRFGVMTQCFGKLIRYATNLETGGHQDSAHDLGVYGAILETLTKEDEHE